MLKMVQRGDYRLMETNAQLKLLLLDDKNAFLWNREEAGKIIITSQNRMNKDTLLAQGKYRLYKVDNEPEYSDQFHLELSVGCGNWQGYILPDGLPIDKKQNHIMPTKEVITKTNRCSECKCGC